LRQEVDNIHPLILEKMGKLNKYFGQLHVLKDIDLEIERGEVIVIIGASGCGKSTLLRCLDFLEIYDSGEIWVNGKKIRCERSFNKCE
jgi:polar amino acid transport system ATP-binding protein